MSAGWRPSATSTLGRTSPWMACSWTVIRPQMSRQLSAHVESVVIAVRLGLSPGRRTPLADVNVVLAGNDVTTQRPYRPHARVTHISGWKPVAHHPT